ncbi:hypothetical protein [Mesorhizobium opportunistum]|uniref:Uncharacterized protein n=1 Tax=Mesorhizobium opportunistum (strain LMG 24607 / HAMBI 3007 / WSM2075) TaxID=536019 RepID=F7XZW1_MESOW|nr:hypothetical protein [Mesorhizobium opportunistum]AEH88175.1 hypothetical protein Mesop_3733 [Mesorhizobium opportunistum WSM2075]
MNVVAALLIFIGMGLISQDICRSLDCIGGNQAACAFVAKRYEAKAS